MSKAKTFANNYSYFVVLMLIVSLAVKDLTNALMLVAVIITSGLIMSALFYMINNLNINPIKVSKHKIDFDQILWYTGLTLVVSSLSYLLVYLTMGTYNIQNTLIISVITMACITSITNLYSKYKKK